MAGHPEVTAAWTSSTNYRLSGLVLATGQNTVSIIGLDREGNIVTTTTTTITKVGQAAPAMSASASPRSWQLGAGETLSLDATSSFDPDGTPLLFTWEVVPDIGVGISVSGPGLAEINFASPGLYTITITGTNSASESTQLVRQAAVYSVSDFANFSASILPATLQAEHIEERDNHSPSAWYSLEDEAGTLVLKMNRDAAYPLVGSGTARTHPFIGPASRTTFPPRFLTSSQAL